MLVLAGWRKMVSARGLSAGAFARAYSRAGQAVQRGHKDFFMSFNDTEPVRFTGVFLSLA
jgi:hypothetical protein